MKPITALAGIATMLLLVIISSVPLSVTAAGQNKSHGPKVSLTISVEATALADAPRRADEETVLKHLATEAEKQAENVLRKRRITDQVEHAASPQKATGDL